MHISGGPNPLCFDFKNGFQFYGRTEVKRRFEMLILFAVQVGENLEEKRYLNDFIVSKSKCYYLLLIVH